MLQRLRLISGLILFSYVSSHLLNHALGLISLQAAEAGRLWFVGFWRQPFVTPVLYSALLCHLTLVLWAVYQRRHLRIPRWEIVRLTLGLLIPLQLIGHVFATRVQHKAFGVEDNYTRVVVSFWLLNPNSAFQQVALLLAAWTHGCMGIHYWLRVKRWHAITVPALRVIGLLVPLLAVGGFVDMAQQVSELAASPEWLQRAFVPITPDQARQVTAWREATLVAFLVTVGTVFLARRIRTLWEQRQKGVVRLTYPTGRQVLITPGTTVLEASRAAGIPHASLCGGRGRCSTCRTRIGSGLESLPRPAADEARVLQRIGAPLNVRLACQIRPTSDLDVFPLLPPATNRVDSFLGRSQIEGREQEVAVLFADLRSFTTLAERRLPYDVLFILNQYFTAMGEAVEQAGGYLDKFLGDGVMALFGVESDITRGAQQALDGAARMGRALADLNRALAYDLHEPLRMGIGLHTGQVIVGEMGYGRARSLTAVGDVVNTASRLEALNKEYGSLLVVSEDVGLAAGVDLSVLPSYDIEIRGRTTPLRVRVVGELEELERALQRGSFSPS